MAELSNASDRYMHALKLVLQRARARTGFLYLLQGEELWLAAASSTSDSSEFFNKCERSSQARSNSMPVNACPKCSQLPKIRVYSA
jgi:hypothetical protein